MAVRSIHHVQLAMPEGGEAAARAFYGGYLGMLEIQKPAALLARGGVWFAAGALQVHLGVEEGFKPARKAHPAFLVDDLSATVAVLAEAGFEATPDARVSGYERVHVSDPFGNRVELMIGVGG